jgi:hypothetical protein
MEKTAHTKEYMKAWRKKNKEINPPRRKASDAKEIRLLPRVHKIGDWTLKDFLG